MGGGAVNGGVGPDFDIVFDYHAADLRDLAVAFAVPVKAKAIRTENDSGMEDTARSDFGSPADCDTGMD